MGNQDVTTHKIVAVLNKKIETGKAMNALAHISIALVNAASDQERADMRFVDYIDKDGGNHGDLSGDSYVILCADNSNKIRTVRNAAKEANVLCIDFPTTAQEGTYVEQIETTKNTPEEELEYIGIVLFGEIEKITELTKKFSLWR